MKVNDPEAAYTHVFNQAEVAVDGTKKDTDSPVHTLPEDPARTPVYVLDDPVKAVLNVDGKNIGTDGNGNMIQTVKQAGDMLFYTVSFGNPADDERTFTITDTLPDGVKFVSADQEGVYSEADHTVTWNVITDAHTEGTVTVKVKVLASAAETELNNQARVGMDEADITTVTDNGGDDDDTTTNFVAVKTVVNAEGTEIDKQVVAVDDLVTYHIPYQNHSKNTRTITIMDVLPQDVTYVEASEGGNVQSIVHGQTGISAYDRIAEIAGGADGTSNESHKGPGGIPASAGSGEADKDECSQTNDPDEDSEEDLDGSERGFHENPEDGSESDDQRSEDLSKPMDLPEINFKALQAVNPDVIGWIYSPNTTINYPVVQGDDNTYYLKHLADETENRNGCPFLDAQNRPDFTDDNSVIYGHHMQNGTMFAGISWYEDQSYYDEHPKMYLMTPSATYRIELFSGYITTMDSSAYMQNFGCIREHTDWLKEVSGRSDFRANLEISAYDRVITLSTCAYRFENARYVLHGKLAKLR